MKILSHERSLIARSCSKMVGVIAVYVLLHDYVNIYTRVYST